MDLDKKSVLITGGTSGIGRALVGQLAGRCGRIVVIGRNRGRLEELRQAFANVSTYTCSLGNNAELEATLGDIRREHPEISVVFNNAGMQETPTLLDGDFLYAQIDREIATNLSAPIKICALMLPGMLSQNDDCAFINISSGLALFPKKNSAVYCATKAGLHSFSQSLRYQLEGTRVSVCEAILPLVDTPMTQGRGRGRGKISADEAAKAIIKGAERGDKITYIGKAKLIPVVARLSPGLMAKIMKSA